MMVNYRDGVAPLDQERNYENNKTKYQERKRGPDAHVTRRAESDGSVLEAVWSGD